MALLAWILSTLLSVQVAEGPDAQTLRQQFVAMQNRLDCDGLLAAVSINREDVAAKYELVQLLSDPREDVRQRAADVLARTPKGWEIATWHLAQPGGDMLAQVRAIRALGGMVTLLDVALAADDPRIRFEGAYSVADGSSESVLHLLELLDDSDANVRAVASEGIAWAIWTQPGRSSDAPVERHHHRELDLGACAVLAQGVDELSRALSDEDPRVRRFAALTARKLGERAEPMREGLVRAADDADGTVRILASAALARLDAGNWPGLPDLAVLERSPRPLRGSSRALLQDAVLDSPHGELQDSGSPSSYDRRFEAAYELARDHLADLTKEARGEGEEGSAHDVLDAMLSAVAEHADLVLSAARRRDGAALQTAVDLGVVVLPALEHEVLRSSGQPYGWDMFEGLIPVIRALGTEALPLLMEWQTSRGRIARYWAADTLRWLGPAAAPGAPIVISAWRNGDVGSRVPGSDPFWEWEQPEWIRGEPNALWSAIGADAIPTLEEALRDPHARVRRRAAKALLGTSGAGACLLRDLLDDEDPTVRVAAATAVLAVGGEQDPAADRARLRVQDGGD